MRVVQRGDQRLNHAEGAVESTRIPPSFEVVGFGDVPVAMFGSLIEMRADVDGVFDFLLFGVGVELNLRRKIEIMRRGVRGVAAENQQCFHFSGIDIGAKFSE